MLLQHSPSMVRMYSSLFSLYRIISGPGNLKLNTITDKFSGNAMRLEEIQRWLGVYTPTSLKTFKIPPLRPSIYEVLISASPGSSCS